MTYHPGLWKDAPEGAVGVARTFVEQADGNEYEEWIFVRQVGAETFWGWFYDGEWQSMAMPKTRFIDLHPRPQAYTPAAQLIEAYRKEHGAEIEADIAKFDEIMGGKDVGGLDDYLDSAVFFTVLIEKHLAAERARVGGGMEVTDNQKARAWDALKVAAVDTKDHAFFNPRLARDCVTFLGLMSEVEARVLKADSPLVKPGTKS